MQYKLYTTSIKAWDAMLEGIEQAKKSVYLEMYIFERDTTTSHDFIGKLKQKARSGVRVIIVADAFGSKALKKEIASTIENSGIEFFILEHWPNKNIYTLKSHYIEKITRAQKSIQITSPYFTPPRWLISLLDDAIRRNVRVEILIPKKVDWRIMNLLNYRYMRALHPLGITFFLSRKMNHAKLLIIDGEEGLIGSQNMDLLSFQLNSEVGIFFKEKALLDELAITIRKWKQNSEIFKPQKYKMKFIDYVILTLLKILYPIL